MASSYPTRPDSPDFQSIVGSSEPLSPEEPEGRLRALAAWGVDLSLVRAQLELTPTERLQRMVDFLSVAEALYESYSREVQRERHG
ncbi:MAG: hypothetical protein ACRDHP_19570 [Ktedonobacterales bacterium]